MGEAIKTRYRCSWVQLGVTKAPLGGRSGISVVVGDGEQGTILAAWSQS